MSPAASAATTVEYDGQDDDIEQMLSGARELIDAVMSRQRGSTKPDLVVDMLHDLDQAQELAQTLISQATEQVLCLVPALLTERKLLAGAPEIVTRVAEQSPDVQCRLLYSVHGPIEQPRFDRGHFGEQHQPAVRLMRGTFPELLIVDQRIALLRCEMEPGKPWACQIEIPHAVHALRAVYATIWGLAQPIHGAGRPCSHRECKQLREVLGPLSAGRKDEVAARELNLSVRTYRRCVADIMRRLGAATRFQAGLRAANSNSICLLAEDPGYPATA